MTFNHHKKPSQKPPHSGSVQQLFASKYRTVLPSEEALKAELERERHLPE